MAVIILKGLAELGLFLRSNKAIPKGLRGDLRCLKFRRAKHVRIERSRKLPKEVGIIQFGSAQASIF